MPHDFEVQLAEDLHNHLQEFCRKSALLFLVSHYEVSLVCGNFAMSLIVTEE